MGKIIRNGIEFSGACEDATAVNYNNSLSGLEAQTVQEGIDELTESLGDLFSENIAKTQTLEDGSFIKWYKVGRVVHCTGYIILTGNTKDYNFSEIPWSITHTAFLGRNQSTGKIAPLWIGNTTISNYGTDYTGANGQKMSFSFSYLTSW